MSRARSLMMTSQSISVGGSEAGSSTECLHFHFHFFSQLFYFPLFFQVFFSYFIQILHTISYACFKIRSHQDWLLFSLIHLMLYVFFFSLFYYLYIIICLFFILHVSWGGFTLSSFLNFKIFAFKCQQIMWAVNVSRLSFQTPFSI